MQSRCSTPKTIHTLSLNDLTGGFVRQSSFCRSCSSKREGVPPGFAVEKMGGGRSRRCGSTVVFDCGLRVRDGCVRRGDGLRVRGGCEREAVGSKLATAGFGSRRLRAPH
ncbi:hypothetical protein TIFTF001_028792 [Ficus carica]|uniref:Uncharacterized protein n=1 Tax=Ficus carica TaxID=3494 RepID=A0AA88DQL8_FICCA|nr:hypothetical protein TIFTF001_028792 [Ficus carica]